MRTNENRVIVEIVQVHRVWWFIEIFGPRIEEYWEESLWVEHVDSLFVLTARPTYFVAVYEFQ